MSYKRDAEAHPQPSGQSRGHLVRARLQTEVDRFNSGWLPPLPARAPAPDLIRTTGGRAYAEATMFYLLVFGVFAVTAILDGAAAWGFHPGWSQWAWRWAGLGFWSTLAVLILWFAAVWRWRLVWACSIGITVLIAGDAVVTSGAMRTPDGMYSAVAAATAMLLAIALARRHGLTLKEFGVRTWHRPDPAGRPQALQVFWWAVAGSCLSSAIGGLMIVLGAAHGQSPIHPHENPASVVLRMLASGVVEEVLVAAVVIALGAARRSAWEMYVLLAVMRVSYHMYYQTCGLSVLAMGVLYVWLYRRTRRLTPIICAHIITDVAAWNLAGRITGPRHHGGDSYGGALLGQVIQDAPGRDRDRIGRQIRTRIEECPMSTPNGRLTERAAVDLSPFDHDAGVIALDLRTFTN